MYRHGLIFVVALFAILIPSHVLASYETKTLKSAKSKAWTAEVRFVQFRGTDPLASYVNAQIKSRAKKVLRDFEQTSKELHMPGDHPHVLNSYCEVDLESPEVISVHFYNEMDVGVGNRSDNLVRLNFGLVGGRPQKLKLADIVNAPKSLAPVIKEALRESIRDRGMDPSIVRNLSRADLESFVITRKGLHYEFNPSDIAPGSARFVVGEIPWSSIKRIRLDGPVSRLARGTKR